MASWAMLMRGHRPSAAAAGLPTAATVGTAQGRHSAAPRKPELTAMARQVVVPGSCVSRRQGSRLSAAAKESPTPEPASRDERFARKEKFETDLQGRRKDVADVTSDSLDSANPQLAEDEQTPVFVAEQIGLGLWNLKGMLDPKLEVCAAYVEAHLRDLLEREIHLGPIDRKYKLCDSVKLADPEYSQPYDPEYPAKGEPGYPRFIIENRVYASRVFRKIHMELAHRQDGMHVFHFVMYPFEQFDVPIFSVDMVSFNGTLTLAVCDACPCRTDMSLPSVYQQGLATIQQQFAVERKPPEWGKGIFSNQCVLVRPTTPEETGAFVKYVVSALSVHLKVSRLVLPVPESERSRRADIKAAHQRYSKLMLENDKTFKALEASFGTMWAREYMEEVMFDTA
mmetsp:Transcript_22628/g.62806  ORF Transcript_22628/g.62806 Transcript_22628/m.62806 type:complete len:397 (-) Transcript_22628:211-1401(-)